LVAADGDDSSVAAISVPENAAQTSVSPTVIAPPVGTACLVVYSAERKPLHYHSLNADVTLIGRSDPVRGDFPDLDIGEFFDDATAKSVSRKHLLVLHSREHDRFFVRPLAKNTGTQIEREMATDLRDYPLSDGVRMLLGGAVRIKFEIIK
jgi:hypothetical protein